MLRTKRRKASRPHPPNKKSEEHMMYMVVAWSSESLRDVIVAAGVNLEQAAELVSDPDIHMSDYRVVPM